MKFFLLGNVRLVIMFWVFLVGGELFFEFLIHIFKSDGIEKNLLAIMVILFLSFIYDALIIVATWNSANKYQGKKIWKLLSKVIVIIKAMTWVISIVGLVFILIQNPNFVDLIISKL